MTLLQQDRVVAVLWDRLARDMALDMAGCGTPDARTAIGAVQRPYCPYLRARLRFTDCPGFASVVMTSAVGMRTDADAPPRANALQTCAHLAAEQQGRGWVAVCALAEGPPIFAGLAEGLARAIAARRELRVRRAALEHGGPATA